jgi:hypothetical protein
MSLTTKIDIFGNIDNIDSTVFGMSFSKKSDFLIITVTEFSICFTVCGTGVLINALFRCMLCASSFLENKIQIQHKTNKLSSNTINVINFATRIFIVIKQSRMRTDNSSHFIST